jgi:hypothetical protein
MKPICARTCRERFGIESTGTNVLITWLDISNTKRFTTEDTELHGVKTENTK